MSFEVKNKKNKMKFIILCILIFSSKIKAFDPLKHENEGCPDNSICSKATGLARTKWLTVLKSLNSNQLSELEANNQIKKTSGYPIEVWTFEHADNLLSLMSVWNSPCKQHQDKTRKILIGEYFTPKINVKDASKNILFLKAVLKENKNYIIVALPRGEAPLNIINKAFYYTKETEGNYFGLHVSNDGNLKATKIKHIDNFPREVECPKDMIEEFYRNVPAVNFFKGHFCKEIWNQDQKNYSLLLTGWSCN